jgi:hypothetical protein
LILFIQQSHLLWAYLMQAGVLTPSIRPFQILKSTSQAERPKDTTCA